MRLTFSSSTPYQVQACFPHSLSDLVWGLITKPGDWGSQTSNSMEHIYTHIYMNPSAPICNSVTHAVEVMSQDSVITPSANVISPLPAHDLQSTDHRRRREYTEYCKHKQTRARYTREN